MVGIAVFGTLIEKSGFLVFRLYTLVKGTLKYKTISRDAQGGARSWSNRKMRDIAFLCKETGFKVKYLRKMPLELAQENFEIQKI